MPNKAIQLSLNFLLTLAFTSCACGRVGTLAERRTLTPTAEVIDIYGLGLLLRYSGADKGITLGWRHATSIYPRIQVLDTKPSVRWSYGRVSQPIEMPFFLAARCAGAEIVKYPGSVQAHLGFQMNALTFAASVEESRVVKFHYRPSAPGQTMLTINPLPPLASK